MMMNFMNWRRIFVVCNCSFFFFLREALFLTYLASLVPFVNLIHYFTKVIAIKHNFYFSVLHFPSLIRSLPFYLTYQSHSNFHKQIFVAYICYLIFFSLILLFLLYQKELSLVPFFFFPFSRI